MEKNKLFLICDKAKGNYQQGAENVGIEYLGDAVGRVVNEKGELIGRSWSSTIGWLEQDLMNRIGDLNEYEIIDLIGKPVPEQFKLQEEHQEGWIYF